jgi:uncharacterized protein (DUF486 family)
MIESIPSPLRTVLLWAGRCMVGAISFVFRSR